MGISFTTIMYMNIAAASTVSLIAEPLLAWMFLFLYLFSFLFLSLALARSHAFNLFWSGLAQLERSVLVSLAHSHLPKTDLW
jgi:hypothetical protein